MYQIENFHSGNPSFSLSLNAQDVSPVARSGALPIEQSLRVHNTGVGADGEDVVGAGHDGVDDGMPDGPVAVDGAHTQNL